MSVLELVRLQPNYLDQLETHLRVIQVQLSDLNMQLQKINVNRYIIIAYEMIGVDEEGLLIEATIFKNWPGIENRSALAALLHLIFPLGGLMIETAWTINQTNDVSIIPLPKQQKPNSNDLVGENILVRLLYRDSRLAVAEMPVNYTLYRHKFLRPLTYVVTPDISMTSQFGILKEVPSPIVLKKLKFILQKFSEKFEKTTVDKIQVQVPF